ncbi:MULTISPECIES: DUF167 domain-containing protein [unclassified Spirosoma]|uniref:DUF167 domain-containing protein n=1 Tax=unclassified Spirosoma TaxID=2621999 RepID=UPI000968AAD3|nr:MULTISPECIES: DUF167 domain-containing protein [unclassified Spirosoma]MBN8824679.1 DUF167 domain-containing protein [Spirosoma sp.]OJW78775.1 MAG: hypothetical protein BGO59_09820 [Spirosoma sp. 48-14]
MPVTLHLKVKPGSKVDQLFYDAAGMLNAKIKAPAQDGKANAYLTEFLAKQIGVAKSNVTIVAGFTNPHKRIELDVDQETYDRFLTRLKSE